MTKRNVSFIGITFIAVGLLVNERMLVLFLSPDGSFEFSLSIRIILFECFAIMTGGWIFVRRQRIARSSPFQMMWACCGWGIIACGILLNEWVLVKAFGLYGNVAKFWLGMLTMLMLVLGWICIRYRQKLENYEIFKRYILMMISIFFVIWSAIFIYKSSFIGIDGQRYFCLFDDAMISMRYAWNFSHGIGLVWNDGEMVEGYTNLLMTLFMSIATFIFNKSNPRFGICSNS